MNIQTSLPAKGNKYYNRKSSGGYSPCIKGNNTISGLDVLNNCVGWATGRFNEIGDYKSCKYFGNTNAENFFSLGQKQGLKVGQIPKQGACMVWEGIGSKAGHVAIVEKVNSNTSVYTSEGGWSATKGMWNATRTKGSGNWGQNSSYKFLGFVYHPAIPDTPSITPNVTKNELNNQIEVLIDNLYVRVGAGQNNSSLGFAKKGYYNFYESKVAGDYTWYRIADNQWIASNQNWTKIYPKQEPKAKFNIGDDVIINGNLYKSSTAVKATGKVSNKKTKITRYAKGAKHPYNTTGDLGWMDEKDITLYVSTKKTYTVQKGDTLSSIAKKYNTTWQKIYAKNKFVIGNNPNVIHTGQILEI